MRTTTQRPPLLRPRDGERDAFACTDAAGNLHWVRVFDSTILGRPGEGWGQCGRRLETPDGSPVAHVEGSRYLLWSIHALEWVEVEAVAGRAEVA